MLRIDAETKQQKNSCFCLPYEAHNVSIVAVNAEKHTHTKKSKITTVGMDESRMEKRHE